MKIKISANGEGTGTRIFTEDGQDISNHVRSVNFKHDPGELPAVTLTMILVGLGFEGQGSWAVIHPETGYTRKVKSISFSDGKQETLNLEK